MRHRDAVIACNPCGEASAVDEALRCALTLLVTGRACAPPACADAALRYVRDRINVPRDMSLWAARRLRQALETTASLAGPREGPALSLVNRHDQNPVPFRRAQLASAEH
jgi:glutathione S-transferase